jgi:obg-like ATPase 1
LCLTSLLSLPTSCFSLNSQHNFLTAKPSLYLINLSTKDFLRKKSKWLGPVKEWVDRHSGEIVLPFSASYESKIIEITANEGEEAAQAFIKESGVPSSIDKIILTGFKALRLQFFFTAGHDEVKAWTIRQGTLAPGAAGTIHSDFERGFICAEVMKMEDFKELGSEAAVKYACA